MEPSDFDRNASANSHRNEHLGYRKNEAELRSRPLRKSRRLTRRDLRIVAIGAARFKVIPAPATVLVQLGGLEPPTS
jgi:hypothetical protein